MIKKIFNKILGIKPKEAEKKPSFFDKFSENSGKFLDFLESSKNNLTTEFSSIREKCTDLQQTNFNLGLKHLENGHLREASFRFFIMRKIWKDDFDAYYYQAYCLILRGKNLKAQKVLNELLQLNPNYDSKARELLEHVNQQLS